jgi:hypothetical protein
MEKPSNVELATAAYWRSLFHFAHPSHRDTLSRQPAFVEWVVSESGRRVMIWLSMNESALQELCVDPVQECQWIRPTEALFAIVLARQAVAATHKPGSLEYRNAMRNIRLTKGKRPRSEWKHFYLWLRATVEGRRFAVKHAL